MQKNTEHIPNRDDVSAAILQHLDGLRGIDTHCHHLPDDQFQNMGVKFLYDHSYCNWMDTYPDDAQEVPEFCCKTPVTVISTGCAVPFQIYIICR